ncbi:response regulator [Paenibacillus tritici]|uniref:Response regulator n=1 Tax=Paenibacillus tritici TaxID=1873425 RepID=A0ABX2DX62_9BACL|nr:response regulator [Paenibacillus tritici]NQX49301.1 response regulator [Paenibacillus tritici]
MLRVVLIDDERLALIQLESTLRALGSAIVTATYTNPLLALNEASGWDADIIFLDIDMPGMNGMEAAKRLEEICPGSALVFVTAHNSFALEAFEASAQDYLLKPVPRERLSRTIQRIRNRKTAMHQEVKKDSLLIRGFNSIQFERDGVPIRDFRWRTSKSQELFAYLLYYHDRIVVKDKLVELLWPEISLKRASTHLYTAIYQLRQSLKRADIGLVISNASVGEGYMLESGDAQIDFVLWEEGIVSLDPVGDHNASVHEELLKLYTGDFLGDYDYLWAESERQRLRNLSLQHATELADYYTAKENITKAVNTYQRIVELHPYHEPGYLALMEFYNRLGELSFVQEQYEKLRRLLWRDLRLTPSAKVERWYGNWKRLYT